MGHDRDLHDVGAAVRHLAVQGVEVRGRAVEVVIGDDQAAAALLHHHVHVS
jgi:hypothetical protein